MVFILSAQVYGPFACYWSLYYISNLCDIVKILETKNNVISPTTGTLPIKYKWQISFPDKACVEYSLLLEALA